MGSTHPNQVLHAVIHCLGVSECARQLGIDRKTISSRLSSGSLSLWLFRELKELARLERERLETDDLSGVLCHLICADDDDDPMAPRPQDTANAMLGAMGPVLQNVSTQPSVIRRDSPTMAHYRETEASIKAFAKFGNEYLASYRRALGLKPQWFRRITAAAVAALLIAACFGQFARRSMSRSRVTHHVRIEVAA
jgi:hypothetical protein